MSEKNGFFRLMVLLLAAGLSGICFAQEDLNNLEADADFLMVQMRYQEAADAYQKIDVSDEGLGLKRGVALYLAGNFSESLRILEPLSVSTNSAVREESLFYCLSAQLLIAQQEGSFLFLDGSEVEHAGKVLSELTSVESKAFRELLLSQILEHLLSRQSSNTKDAMLGAIEMVNEQLGLMDQSDPRTCMLWVKLGYLQDDHDLVNRHASLLLASGVDIETDPFLYDVYWFLSKSLYEAGKIENVILEGSGFASECSTRADTALYYGVKYLELRPDDEAFADWVANKVLMSLFLQTKNPGYLVDILEVGRPVGSELEVIHKLAKGVLRFGERRQTFDKADAILTDSMFSSEYWNQRGRIELMGRETFLVENRIDSSVIQSVLNRSQDRVPVLIGGAMVWGSQSQLKQALLVHNNKAVENKTIRALVNHRWLSGKLFGEQMSVLHSHFIDGDKTGGIYHRMFSGHDLKWLVNNLDEMAEVVLKDGTKVGKKRATLIWLQHTGQDFFSTMGIPTPITKPVFDGAIIYAQTVKKLGADEAKTWATKVAAKTCINAVRAVNVAMWGWVAYETYDACQDFAAEQDIRKANDEVQLAMFYGDLGGRCNKLERLLSSERSKERTAAENLLLNITLARLYALGDKPKDATEKLNEVLKNCRNMALELSDGPDLGDPDIEDRAEGLDKLSRKIKEVLIQDSTFNASISCEGYASESQLLVVDEKEKAAVLGDAVGAYHRTGDALLKRSKIERSGKHIDVAWSAAVNFYRAARLAQAFEHKDASLLAEKAVNVLYEMRMAPGPLTEPLIEKMRRDWLAEFGMLGQVQNNLEEIRVFRERVPQELKWYELNLSTVKLNSSLLEKECDLLIEFIRRSNGIETTLMKEKLEGVVPDKKAVVLERFPLCIASDDEYELRFSKPGLDMKKVDLWTVLYYSGDYRLSKSKGLMSLVQALSDNDHISIEADLTVCRPYVLDVSGLKLSEDAAIVAEEKNGVVLVSQSGRDPIALNRYFVSDDRTISRKWIDLDGAKQSMQATGFSSILLYRSAETSIDIDVLQAAPLYEDKLIDADIFMRTGLWVAFEHLTYGNAVDRVTSFQLSPYQLNNELERRSAYSVDGSVLEFSGSKVEPVSGVLEN